MDLTKDDIITVDLSDLGTLDPYYGAVPPASVTINSTLGPNASTDWSTITIADPMVERSTLTLRGEDADIDINGVSLMETLKGIQERLNMLTPDPDMEQEWSELATIRKMYDRKLEECRAKSKVWQSLKS